MPHNFINPTRVRNSSIYNSGIPVNMYPRQHVQRMVPLQQPRHMMPVPQQPRYQKPIQTPALQMNIHQNNGSKSRLKQLQHERERLSSMLREKEDEELRMIEKMEADRKERERQEIEKIQEDMTKLKQQLREREQMEKWYKERTEKTQVEKERQQIQLIQKRKDEIQEQILQNESNIQRLKDKSELMRLEQEKSDLNNKWKERDIQKAEERKRMEAQSKIEEQKRKEIERINKMELDRLNQETQQLKDHLQTKLNEEKWLAKRVGEEEYVRTVMKGIRQQKRNQFNYEKQRARIQNSGKKTTCATCALDDDDVSTDSSTMDDLKQMASTVPQPVEPVIQEIMEQDNPSKAVFNTLEKDIQHQLSSVENDKDVEDFTFMMKSLKAIQEMYETKTKQKSDSSSKSQTANLASLSLPSPRTMSDPNFDEAIQTGGPPNTIDSCLLENTMENLDQILQQTD